MACQRIGLRHPIGLDDYWQDSWLLSVGVYQLMGGTPGVIHQIPNYYVTKENIADFPKQVGAAT